jgi:hypothetical protein
MRAATRIVTVLTVLGLPAGPAARGPLVQASGTGAAADRHAVYSYALNARVHVLLLRVKRSGVGAARVVREAWPDGRRSFELLIGSDPDKAPMHINRWGYISETVRGNTSSVVGVMTQSDEDSVESARASMQAQKAGSHPFKAIRATVAGGRASAEVLCVNFEQDFTFRDVHAVLARLPAVRAPSRSLEVPEGTSPGFLGALADLVHDSVAAWGTTGRAAAGGTRTFVWDRGLYELKLTECARADTLMIGERKVGPCLKGEFEIRTMATGDRTKFELTYGTSGPMAEVPVRIVYGPRWWFEIELTFEDNDGRSNAALQ